MATAAVLFALLALAGNRRRWCRDRWSRPQRRERAVGATGWSVRRDVRRTGVASLVEAVQHRRDSPPSQPVSSASGAARILRASWPSRVSAPALDGHDAHDVQVIAIDIGAYLSGIASTGPPLRPLFSLSNPKPSSSVCCAAPTGA